MMILKLFLRILKSHAEIERFGLFDCRVLDMRLEMLDDGLTSDTRHSGAT